MKICFAVTNELVNDYRVFKEADSLGKKHEVKVLGFLRGKVRQKEKKKGFMILRTKEPLIRRIFVRSKKARGFVTEDSKGSGVLQFIRTVINDSILYVLFLNRGRCIYKGLRRIDADVYTAHDLDTLKACVKIAKRNGARVVYDSHELCVEEGFIKTGFFKWLMRNRERKYIRQCDAVITVNDSIANILKKWYRLSRKPHVIRNCPGYVKTNQRLGKSKVKKILFIGVLAATRGLEELIISMNDVNNAVLYIRGFGTAKKRLQKLVERKKLTKKVVFLKAIPPRELVKESRFADIGVMPYKPTSLNNKLVSPNKIYQYMMSGLAIAGSNIPEVKRVIEDNKIGLVFDPNKPKDIARALSKLSSEGLLNKCKKNSLKTAKKYCWENEEHKLLDIYSILN